VTVSRLSAWIISSGGRPSESVVRVVALDADGGALNRGGVGGAALLIIDKNEGSIAPTKTEMSLGKRFWSIWQTPSPPIVAKLRLALTKYPAANVSLPVASSSRKPASSDSIPGTLDRVPAEDHRATHRAD
jgi:hypothetical protein